MDGWLDATLEDRLLFLLDITALVKPREENTVTVKVTDPAEGMSYFMDTHSLINVSGIWRNVWLEATGKTYVSDAFVLPKIEQSVAESRVQIVVEHQLEVSQMQLRILVTSPDGEEFTAQRPFSLSKGATKNQINLEVPVRVGQAVLWELDNPKLYQAEYKVLDAKGETLDSATVDFGMRSIETRGDRILH
jgi:beta-galactosidase/beta-glucuronidase